jgi:hypothetical protein
MTREELYQAMLDDFVNRFGDDAGTRVKTFLAHWADRKIEVEGDERIHDKLDQIISLTTSQ